MSDSTIRCTAFSVPLRRPAGSVPRSCIPISPSSAVRAPTIVLNRFSSCDRSRVHCARYSVCSLRPNCERGSRGLQARAAHFSSCALRHRMASSSVHGSVALSHAVVSPSESSSEADSPSAHACARA